MTVTAMYRKYAILIAMYIFRKLVGYLISIKSIIALYKFEVRKIWARV